jgi:hypothetical protein
MVWTQRLEEKSFALYGIEPQSLSLQPDFILTELPIDLTNRILIKLPKADYWKMCGEGNYKVMVSYIVNATSVTGI